MPSGLMFAHPGCQGLKMCQEQSLKRRPELWLRSSAPTFELRKRIFRATSDTFCRDLERPRQ
jgi:hypothetical protein